MEKIKRFLKNLSKRTKHIIGGAIAGALTIIILIAVFYGSGSISISVETSLRDIIAISQLHTAEYTYNSIAVVQDGNKIKYHVAYKGTVSAGFDFENVKVVRDGKTLKVIVPDVEIMEVIVDPELDYIFVKKKYDTEETYAEATAACKKDLRAKAEGNETLLKTARESAEATLNALIKPFESRLETGETVEIIFSAAKETEAQ